MNASLFPAVMVRVSEAEGLLAIFPRLSRKKTAEALRTLGDPSDFPLRPVAS
jgi:hypothetical protein